MKRKWMAAAALLIVVSGCSNESIKEDPKEEETKTEVADASAEKAEVQTMSSADMKKLEEAVPALVNEISNKLENVKLPSMKEGLINTPSSNLGIEEDSFHLYLSLADTSNELPGIPLNISIRTFEQGEYQYYVDEGYTKKELDREYLIAPNDSKRIVFIDGDNLYSIDSISSLMDYEGSTYSIDELLKMASELTTDSEYKSFFKIDLVNYQLPTYFLNDGKEPYRLFVTYSGKEPVFSIEEQSLQISNRSMNFEQSALYPHYEAFGEEVVIQENVGYLSYGDNAQFELVNGERLFGLSLALDSVNQTTGKPSYVEVANWQEEVTKVIESLNLPKQDSPTRVKDTSEYEKKLEAQQREREMRHALIKEIYTMSTLDESVFFEIAVQFSNVGPEISAGYMKDQLSSRYRKVNKEFENINLMEISKTHLGLQNEEAIEGIDEILGFYEINPLEVFYLQDDVKGEPTYYWILQMEQSVQGYKVINIYDAEQEMFLTDF